MLFVDWDNAIGSPRGDVDDAFAVAALMLGGAEIAAVWSVAGNTSGDRAFENNARLARLVGWRGPLLRAAGRGGLHHGAAMAASTFVRFGRGTREVRVCTKGKAPLPWERFLSRTH